jgi:hypothetical protein
MSEQTRQGQLGDAMAAVLSEPAGAEHYRRLQRAARRGKTDSLDGARPLEFDESGFPIPQRNPSFATRVARLLTTS